MWDLIISPALYVLHVNTEVLLTEWSRTCTMFQISFHVNNFSKFLQVFTWLLCKHCTVTSFLIVPHWSPSSVTLVWITSLVKWLLWLFKCVQLLSSRYCISKLRKRIRVKSSGKRNRLKGCCVRCFVELRRLVPTTHGHEEPVGSQYLLLAELIIRKVREKMVAGPSPSSPYPALSSCLDWIVFLCVLVWSSPPPPNKKKISFFPTPCLNDIDMLSE